MVDIVKPDISSVWAEAGAVIAPSNEKIKLGWTSEVPPHQYENFVQNRQDEMLAYLNQKGVPEWRIDTEYFLGKSFVQDAGKIYKANKNSGGLLPNQKPSTDATNEYWEQATFSLSDLKQDAGTSTKDVMSQNATTLLKENALGGMGRTHTANATFTAIDNKIVMPSIVTALQLEVGDVIQFSNAVAQNNKPRTVESITDADTIIVNYEHCGARGNGSLKLTDETVAVTSVKLLAKWFVAPIGLGQAWVNMTSLRPNSTNLYSLTNRVMSCSIAAATSGADQRSCAIIENGSILSSSATMGVFGASTRVSATAIIPNSTNYEYSYTPGISYIKELR